MCTFARVFSFVCVFFVLNASTSSLVAQSASDITAVYEHKMLALEQKVKLNELNADDIINIGGVIAPVKTDAAADMLRAVLAGCEHYTPWIVMDELKIGDVGRLRYPTNVSASHPHAIVTVTQVLNETEFIGKVFGQTYWIKGVDTKMFTDGKELILTDILEVIGNKTYNTAIGGTNTVMQFEVTDSCKAAQALRESLVASPPDEYENYFRWWTAKNGKKISARLSGKVKSTLKFEKLDGEIIEVKRNQLHVDSKKIASKVLKAMDE